MGGKGRGVLSDFRMGRVRRYYGLHVTPDTLLITVPAVPIPNERIGRKYTRSKEGQLVTMSVAQERLEQNDGVRYVKIHLFQ